MKAVMTMLLFLMNGTVPVSSDSLEKVLFETCVQPSDLSIDANRILSIAPGEGKTSSVNAGR